MGRIFPVGNEGQAFPEFGEEQGAPVIRSIGLNLDTARSKVEIEIGGNFLWAVSATDGSTSIQVAFSRESADEGLEFKNGTRISGLPFSRLFVTHAAQPGKTITLVYAVEAARRGLEIDNPAGDFTSITQTKPTSAANNADQTLAINTTAVVVAASATRRRLWVEADINNTEDLRVAPNGSIGDTQGLRLTPGAAVELLATVAYDIRNPSTNTATQTWRFYSESD